MPTVTLRVKENSLHKLYELLNQLPEVEVIEGETDFQAAQAYLNDSLQSLLTGKNQIVPQEELEKNIEDIIIRYES